MYYQGPATLDLDNGESIPVDLTLTSWSESDGEVSMEGWGGTVTGDPQRLYDAFVAGGLRVILPDGAAGDAAITWHEHDGEAELTGSGPPPTAG